jgi:hypothetical protein
VSFISSLFNASNFSPKVLRIIAVNGVRNVSATHKMASVLGIEKGSNEALEVCAFFPTSQDKLIMLQVNLVSR